MKVFISILLLSCIRMACYAQPGTLDSSFGVNGIESIHMINSGGLYALSIQSDQKMVAVGWGDSSLIRLNEDGTFDKTFGYRGRMDIAGSSLNFQVNGGFIIVRQDSMFFNATRYKNNGMPDSSFNGDGTIINYMGEQCYGTVVQTDGKIVIAGSVHYQIGAMRYNPNGLLDSSFNKNGVVSARLGGYVGEKVCILIQPLNKIVLTGYNTTIIDSMGHTRNDFILLRYSDNGSLDSSFGTNGIVVTDFASIHNFATSAVLQPDGKILVAGTSQQPNSSSDFAIARFSADGVPDSSFGIDGKVTADIDTGKNDVPRGIALQADGKIVLAGISYSAITRNVLSLARFTISGSLDSTFGKNGKVIADIIGIGGQIMAVAIQSNGKIVVAGYAEATPGTLQPFLARYLGDGQVSVSHINQLPQSNRIYPNPTTGICTLTADSYKDLVSITVSDMLGNCVIKINYNFGASRKTELNLSQLPRGIYTVRIQDKSESGMIKVTKQ